MSASAQPDGYRALAAYYDLIYAKVGPDDVPFYLDHAARQAGPVLELGCGTGRVTLPLARAGFHVTALDLSPAMLEQLRAKLAQEPAEAQARVTIVEGDMAQFELERRLSSRPEEDAAWKGGAPDGGAPDGDAPDGGAPVNGGVRFALIIAPFRAFQHLLEPAQQRSMLARVRAHLAPGGVYIHDQFEPNYRFVVENMQRGESPRLDCTVELPGGGLVQRYVTLRYDLGRQRLDAQFRMEEFAADGVLRQTVLERVAMRLTHRQELLYLLELCGLRVAQAFDGYDGAPLGPELAREIVLVCQRA
jgi:SAM-dependent methyltransferase